jgi:hypothetical protein
LAKRTRAENLPLNEAALIGNLAVVRELVSGGARINRKGFRGETPLMVAAREGYSDIVGELLARGAEVNKEDEDGRTALRMVSKSDGTPRPGFNEIHKLLISHGAMVFSENDETNRCFVDYGDGTVRDMKSGLMWQQKDYDCSGHHNGLGDFEEGCLRTKDNFAGHDDWRLPTKDELVDFRKNIGYETILRKKFFPTMKTDFYVTGTRSGINHGYPNRTVYDFYIVDFGPGNSVHNTRWNGTVKGSLELFARFVRRDDSSAGGPGPDDLSKSQ